MISSHGIFEKQETLLVMTVRQQLISEVRGKRFILLIADQSTDISKKEQPCPHYAN